MMFNQIKKPTIEKQEAISWLLSCHTRIRHFTALAKQIATTQASASEIQEAAEAVHRYFTIALPLHEQDEEESLLPRLIGKKPEIDVALLQMKQEHRHIDQVVSNLCQQLSELITLCQSEKSSTITREALQESAVQLSLLWETHLEKEETILFGFANQELSNPEKEELQQEMKSRRNLSA